MKYIIVQSDTGLPAAILFNEVLQHRDVAAGRQVTGAGFCNALGHVWGRSDSLDINSKIEDATHVKFAMNFAFNPQPAAA